jgi:hypothetical protein
MFSSVYFNKLNALTLIKKMVGFRFAKKYADAYIGCGFLLIGLYDVQAALLHATFLKSFVDMCLYFGFRKAPVRCN